VPGIPRRAPARILTEDERWHQLNRLLNDTALPTDVRSAGALVLFGMPTSRIRYLRTDHLRESDGHMHLAIGSPPVLVPPKLAALLRQLDASTGRRPWQEIDSSTAFRVPAPRQATQFQQKALQ
jgi:hypothetical protein